MKQILNFLTASLASWNEEVEKTSPSSTKEKTALELYESALLSLRPVKKEDGPLGATVATAQPDGNGKAGGEEAATLENATPIQTAPNGSTSAMSGGVEAATAIQTAPVDGSSGKIANIGAIPRPKLRGSPTQPPVQMRRAARSRARKRPDSQPPPLK